MNDENHKLLIVGDNPFQGISHLSQERARTRGETIVSPADQAADIILASLKNGADGFSFSVSELLSRFFENCVKEKVLTK